MVPLITLDLNFADRRVIILQGLRFTWFIIQYILFETAKKNEGEPDIP